jgi:hypothetical protein
MHRVEEGLPGWLIHWEEEEPAALSFLWIPKPFVVMVNVVQLVAGSRLAQFTLQRPGLMSGKN